MGRICVVLAMSFGFLFALDTRPVLACTTGEPLTVRGMLNYADYVVRAHAVESDDAGQNVILRIESYLAGGAGPEHILFNRNHPTYTEYLLAGRSTGADCLYLQRDLLPSHTFYVFLRRHDNGSYSVISHLYHFPEAESTVELFLEGRVQDDGQILEFIAERGSGQDVTEAEFTTIIRAESGEEPTPPDPDSLYPLKAPLLITTSDRQYILPVDWQDPIPVPLPDADVSELWGPLYYDVFWEVDRCARRMGAIISPDNLNAAIVTENNTVCFSGLIMTEVDGQAVLFSTTSHAAVVWNDCQLSLYTMGYPRLLQERSSVEYVNSIDLIASDCSRFHQAAAWSPDGRMLAFADERGISLWDAYTLDSAAQHIITHGDENRVLPRFFSQQGRYLNFSDGYINRYIDLISGALLPDGVMSPDDRMLISFDTNASSSEYELCSLTPFSCIPGYPMSIWFTDSEGNMESFHDLSHVSEVQWQHPASFLVLACKHDDSQRCAVFGQNPAYHGWWPYLSSEAIDFDYDRHNRALAYVRNVSTIVVQGTVLDTTQWFDAEAQSVEWLPSLFYHHND